MKMSIGKRILMFFHWLLSLLIVAAFAVYLIVPDFLLKYYNMLVDSLGFEKVKIIGIALLALYVILAILQVSMIFSRRHKDERGFITVDSSDSGRVRIAIAAIEQMVRQSVTNIDGITEMKIVIENLDEAIGIRVNANIVNGCHVPTITMNMQRAIRQFVETNCGVAVREVAVSINAVTNQPENRRSRRRVKRQEALPASPTQSPVDYDFTKSEPEPESEPEPVYESVIEPVYEPEPEPEPVVEAEPEAPAEPVCEAPAGEPEAEYDFDKPYESQFAKDLAEMKAREAEEADASDGDDE